MSRIKSIERLIRLHSINNHITVELIRNGRRIKIKTSIHDGLTAFERQCVKVFFYRERDINLRETNAAFKKRMHTNYAGIFGSMWELDTGVL